MYKKPRSDRTFFMSCSGAEKRGGGATKLVPLGLGLERKRANGGQTEVAVAFRERETRERVMRESPPSGGKTRLHRSSATCTEYLNFIHEYRQLQYIYPAPVW